MSALRSYLDGLDHNGDLVSVTDPVERDFEVAGCLHLADGGPAVLLENVGGSRVVGNLLATRERFARCLRVPTADLNDRLVNAIENPLEPVTVETAPFLAHQEPCDLDALPLPRFYQRETGRYITGGVICARSPESGRMNLSFARIKVLDSTHGLICISPNHHLSRMVAEAAEVGQRLPVAVAIGVDPAVEVAACLYLGYGESEEGAAGALRGVGLPVVPMGPDRINVPADAEYVLCGLVDGNRRVAEGPVSEFHGMYEDYGSGFVMQFTQVCSRDDALFRVVLPGLNEEHLLLGAVSIAAGLTRHLRDMGCPVVDVAVPVWADGRCAAVVSASGLRPGDARRIMLACMSRVSLIREVTVVDPDIDVWDPVAVAWARINRCRAGDDLLILPGIRSDRSDPLAEASTVDKIGFDATTSGKERTMGWEFARVPEDVVGQLASGRGAGIMERMAGRVPGIGLRVPLDPEMR